ncbi:hypothetical protein GCM10009111_01430 [Colwellia asteriadis]|uniref:Toxin co-regulated pilus biosynthesis protein Q C-terminal domain-containing protein n=1 Tax=Colwellia asteriadis TaxID=517723 RepID=A0ABN1L2B3_9GAMM
MNFWLRNLILGAVLLALAVAFLANQDLLLSLDGSLGQTSEDVAPSPDPNAEATEIIKTTPKAVSPKPSNSAAEGLSKFYANLHGDMSKDGPQIRNNVIYLPELKGNLVELLETRGKMVRPYTKNWQGSIESRPFRKGETLNQKLAEYTEQEGVELLWWLDKDFIIKDPFRIEKNILATVFKAAKAIEGHFESGLSIFFCRNQRSIVVVKTEPHPFLEEECALLKSETPY